MIPPKKYEDPSDPRFDSIRHFPWFKHIEKRANRVARMRAANGLISQGMGVCEAASRTSSSRRELADYISFVNGVSKFDGLANHGKQIVQLILDKSYHSFLKDSSKPITHYIMMACRTLGAKPRPIIDMWELDPKFLPTQNGTTTKRH